MEIVSLAVAAGIDSALAGLLPGIELDVEL